MPVFHTASEDETIALGEKLAHTFPPGATVLLIGNLGAGKTTFTKGVVQGLGAAAIEEVSSPTFTLIHEYGSPPAVYHVDLYRLESAREVSTLGLDELFDSNALVLIEWGERFLELMPSNRIEIRLKTLDGDDREIEVSSLADTRPTA